MKKIVLTIFTICACFLFSNKAMALACLYESTNDDGGMVKLVQHSLTNFGTDYYAHVTIVKPFTYDGKNFPTTTRDNNKYFSAENDVKIINEWKKKSKCQKYLTLVHEIGQYTAFTCDTREDGTCFSKKGKNFKLINNPYTGETEEQVSLNSMHCTFSLEKTNEYTSTFSFEITFNDKNNPDKGGHYKLYHNGHFIYDKEFDKKGIQDSLVSPFNHHTYTYYDYFTIRAFWNEETNAYKCPEAISVKSENKSLTIDGTVSTNQYWIHYDSKNITDKNYKPHSLENYASYVEYDPTRQDINISNYTFDEKICNAPEYETLPGCIPETYLSLRQQKNLINNEIELQFFVNESYTKFPESVELDFNKKPTGAVDDYLVIYTDCMNKDIGSKCKISDREFTNSKQLHLDGWTNTQDSSSVEQGMGNVNGFEYKKMVCQLSDRLRAYTGSANLNGMSKLVFINSETKVEYDINQIDKNLCTNWGISTGFKCTNEFCKENLKTVVENNVTEIRSYCNTMYKLYLEGKNDAIFTKRKDECFAFDSFYNDLVSKGIINDLSIGCDFVTPELAQKLTWILDLLKIAGPIAALGLGTLDFVKAIASGDADKEMKSAFKKFTTRIMAAALLFVIPLILAFMMDTFLGNQDGYDPDNPFCNVVDWTD